MCHEKLKESVFLLKVSDSGVNFKEEEEEEKEKRN